MNFELDGVIKESHKEIIDGKEITVIDDAEVYGVSIVEDKRKDKVMENLTLTELIKVVHELPNMILPTNEFKTSVIRGRTHRIQNDLANQKEVLHQQQLPIGTIPIQLDQVNITDQNFDWMIRSRIIITEDEFKSILTQGEALIGFLCPY